MRTKLYAKVGTAAGALLMFVASGQAQANVAINSGFYAGLSAGMSSLSGNQSFNQTETLPGPVTERDNRSMGLSAQSAGLALFAGYGHKWNCLWLGAELSYLFDRLNDNRTDLRFNGSTVNKNIQARTTGALGGAIHVGYIHHSNCLAYVILGLERRSFQMNFRSPNAGALGEPSAVSKKHSSLAFVPGVGMLVKLTKNISLRGEYKYALHRSRTATGSIVDANGDTQVSTQRISPRVQTFQVGVVYSF